MSEQRMQEMLDLLARIEELAETEINSPLGLEIQQFDRLCLERFPEDLEPEELTRRVLADPETRRVLHNIAAMVAAKESEMNKTTKNEVNETVDNNSVVNPNEENEMEDQKLQEEGRVLDQWCHESETGPISDTRMPGFALGYACMAYLSRKLGAEDAAQRTIEYLKEYRQVAGVYYFGETGMKGEKFVLGNGKDGLRIKNCAAMITATLNALDDKAKEEIMKAAGFKLGIRAKVVGFISTLPSKARGWGETLYATKVIRAEIAADVVAIPKPDKEGLASRVVRIGKNSYRMGKRVARFVGRAGKKTLGAILLGPGFCWRKICEAAGAVKSFFQGLFAKQPATASV